MSAHNTGDAKIKTDLLGTYFQDGQGNNSITAQDMRHFIESTANWARNSGGWEFLFDSVYTSGAPLTLLDGVPAKLTITSNPGEELRYPPGFPGAWDDPNNRLHPALLNGFGIIRISFEGVFVGGTAPHIDFNLDVGSNPIPPAGTGVAGNYGSGSNIIYAESTPFAKASGTVQHFNYIMPLFVGADFAANGGVFIIKADGDDIDIYNIAMTAGRIFAPDPSGFIGS